LSDLLSLDATAQLQALESRRLGAVELLQASVARYRALNPAVNAVTVTDLERASATARAVDDRRARGEAQGRLAGLPMTIKDSLDVEGMPASSGLAALLKRTAKDAAAVARTRTEGAVIWGKTNLPVMTADWQSYNSVYGTTNNPWDLSRTPGGSSGGAAAALAVGITALEIGSDIGGSLRTPASFCGVFSHKPTYGLVPQRGQAPPMPGAHADPDLNVAGPMARSARDLRLLLSVIAEGPIAPKAPPAEIRGLKVGVWLEEPAFPLDPEVAEAVAAFAQGLAGVGAAVEALRPVDGAVLLDAYLCLLLPIMGRTLPPKQRRTFEMMRGPAKLARALGAGPTSWASQVLRYSATHDEWLTANETRARIGDQMKTLFERLDVLIAPIAPVVAFPHDHRPFNRRTLALSNGRTIPYASMLNWIALATACGLPATAIPIGPGKRGLPIGLQIIGPKGGDAKTLAVAQAFEEAFGGFVAPNGAGVG
jgi:amidase